MRVVVTGSREWTYRDLLRATLDGLHDKYGISLLVHGEQTGADLLCKQWAMDNGVPVFGCPYAGKFGKQGGPIRNGWLLDFADPVDLVVAFPTESSVGTWNMVTQAKQRGLPIRIVRQVPVVTA